MTATRWSDVVVFEEVTSTQDVALQRASGGATIGEVIVAFRQSAGRGRRGRSWLDTVRSADDQPANLAVTAVASAPVTAGLVPLATGLAVADTYSAAGTQPALKWPNDVLLDGRKVAGILVEQHTVGRERVVLVGSGFNLDWRGVERSNEALQWVSLAEITGVTPDRTAILIGYLANLDARLQQLDDDPHVIIEEYRDRCTTIGRSVAVALPAGDSVAGLAIGVDDDGQLLIDTSTVGRPGQVSVSAGDVTHVRPVPS